METQKSKKNRQQFTDFYSIGPDRVEPRCAEDNVSELIRKRGKERVHSMLVNYEKISEYNFKEIVVRNYGWKYKIEWE